MPNLTGLNCCDPLYGITNIANSYAINSEDFVANKVFPLTAVQKNADKYSVYTGKGDTEQFVLSNYPYFCERLCRHEKYNCFDVIMSKPLELGIMTTIAAVCCVLTDNEKLAANVALNKHNYVKGNHIQLAKHQSWLNNEFNGGKDGYFQSFPMSKNIAGAKRAVLKSLGKPATHILLNTNAAKALSKNWQFLDRIQYCSKEGLTPSGLPPVMLGLEVIEAPSQIRLTDGDEKEPRLIADNMWQDDQGQDCALVYCANATSEGFPVRLGSTIEALDETLNIRGFHVKHWHEEWSNQECFEARVTRDHVFTSTDGTNAGHRNNGLATAGCIISGVTL